MPTQDSERRDAKRISYPCEVRGFALGTSLAGAHITNLSITGAFIETAFDVPERTVLLLKFRVDDVNVKTEAAVVRRDPPHGLAVRFVNLSPEHRAAIERAIEHH